MVRDFRNGSMIMQRIMDGIFSGMNGQNSMIYLDDIIVYERDGKTYLNKLGMVLKKFSETGIRVNKDKS